MSELRREMQINGVTYCLAVNQYGKGAPTSATPGKPAVLYMDTDTGELYKCTAADVETESYTWEMVASKGADGTSPTVAVSAITGGHRITITDVNGTKTVDVMDGEDGGYYTPSVRQPDGENMEVAFTPSKEDMPAVAAVQVKLPVPDSSQNVDLTGYATEQYVQNYAQPKGNYLTDAPVDSVNGKTGAVNLTASDVGALPDTTVIPTVPTKVSAFENDAGYLTDEQTLAEANETPVLGDELASASGWTSDGWTGDFTNGFTHTSGNTNALSFAIPGIAVGKAYVVEFDCSVDYTNTNLQVTIGSAPAMLLYGLGRTNTKVGVIAVDTGALTFTPESAFVGQISGISIREITADSTPRETIRNSSGTVVNEVRHIGESLFMGVSAGGKTVPGTAGNYAIGNGDTFQNNISGFWNVAIGTDCMNGNVSGSRNVSIGANNLRNNVEGCRNVSIGNFCMAQTRNAHRNVAIGGDCMSTATGGEENTAIGFRAMYTNTTGYNNVAVGSNTLLKNTTGLGNVALGYSALSKVTTGRNNIAIGYAAGDTITTGNGNIIIGANADVSGGANYYVLNIGNLLKGSVQSGAAYLLVNGGLRLPSIGTEQTANSDVYSEEWTFTLEDGSTVTKKVLMV